jgi:hypothetical protein
MEYNVDCSREDLINGSERWLRWISKNKSSNVEIGLVKMLRRVDWD